jgi:MFS transporter, PPP family, 3-phenylpropionic acid transporter
LTTRLSLYYGTMFLIVGIYVPFWPIWLTTRGMDATDIGILLGSATVMKVFGSPLIARLVDRRGQRRKALILLSLFSFLTVLFYFVFDGFLALLLISAMTALFLSPLVPLTDNLTLMLGNSGKVDYGRVRVWGSITYALAALLGGMWLEGRSEEWVLWLLVGASGLMAISSFGLPDVKTKSEEQKTTHNPQPLAPLLRQPVIWMFLLGAGMTQGSHVLFYGFSTLHWQSAGISRKIIGYLWAIGVFVEIILFAFATAWLKRFDPVLLLLVAASAAALRWAVTGWTDDLFVLFVAQALHGITLGVAHLGAMFFLARAIPVSLSASAQSLYSSVSLGLIFAVAMPTAGYLYKIAGGDAFYFMAAMSGLALLVLFGLHRSWNRGELQMDRPA